MQNHQNTPETPENTTPVCREKRVLQILSGLFLLLSLLFTLLPRTLYGDALTSLGDILVRASAATAIILLLGAEGVLHLSLRVRPRARATVVAVILIFLVALNNFPFENLLSGRATLTFTPLSFALYVLSALATAAFEESLFRGLLLPLFLERAKPTRRALVAAIVLSSLLFGGMHLVNLASAPLPATLLQVTYTFGIGIFASLLFLFTGSILLPVLFHALYNFGGYFLSTFGAANTPTLGTILFTTALAVVTGIFSLLALFAYARAKFTNSLD